MEVQHLEPMGGEKKQIKTLHNILSCVEISLFCFSLSLSILLSFNNTNNS